MGKTTGRINNQRIFIMSIIEFKEVQSFRRWWAWAALVALNGLFIYAIIFICSIISTVHVLPLKMYYFHNKVSIYRFFVT